MFVLSIILFILAVLATITYFFLRPKSKKAEPETTEKDSWRTSSSTQSEPPIGHKIALGIASVLYALGILFMILCIFFAVGTKKVAVVTEYGKPVGTPRGNGLQTKDPWQKKTELDAAIQTDSHTGKDNCTTIRIGNQSTACVDNSIRWQIIPDKAGELFRDYREFDNIRDSLVTRQLNAALNEVFATYNPLSTVATDDKKASAIPTLDALSKQVTTLMKTKVGNQINVLEVLIPLVSFDGPTQDKINAFQAEIGNTRIAQQKEQTAIAEAKANGKLAASVSRDPNVLVSKCLDTLGLMAKEKQQIPAGFSCWPGGGSAIVVPSATTPK